MRFIRTSMVFSVVVLTAKAQISEKGLMGYWLVEKVQVGSRTMTPDAKWIHFRTNQSFVGGNGFLRNSAGLYTYDSLKANLKLNDSLSLEDPFGSFKVKCDKDRMDWQRVEEGQEVKVSLKRTTDLPMAMSDQLRGLWKEKDSFSLFLSWDRSYRKFLKNGSTEQGVWRNHPHRPELVLIPWDQKKTSQFYKIEKSSSDLLKLTDLQRGKTMFLERSNQFPTH